MGKHYATLKCGHCGHVEHPARHTKNGATCRGDISGEAPHWQCERCGIRVKDWECDECGRTIYNQDVR
jgi:hypothetical protein